MGGIVAYGAYIPMTRLPLALIAGRTPRADGPEKAVAYYDEDSVTMAVAAAVDCLGDLDRSTVDAVMFASTTYPFREKQGAVLIAKALDLRRDVETADYGGSLRAGTDAIKGGLNAVAAGACKRVLVIASDCRMAAPRGALEANLGDGAAAFLIDTDGGVATLEASYAIANELQDLWRTEGDAFTHSWEDRFVVQEGYEPAVQEAVRGLCEKLGAKVGDFDRVALYAHDGRSHAAMVRRLKLAGERVQDALFGKLGNTGASFAPLLFAAALENAQAGERILLVSYGDGAEAFAFRVGAAQSRPRLGVGGHLKRKRGLRSYESFLRSRQLTPSEWDNGTNPGLSATIRFRERDTDISLVGAACKKCGQVHLPKPRVCAKCYARDQWEPYRLSDKQGRLLAYTFDFFFPAAEPPAIMTMADVEGCRVHIQLADAAPDQVHLDMPVGFMFRKIHDAGGKPNYFWKAVPVE